MALVTGLSGLSLGITTGISSEAPEGVGLPKTDETLQASTGYAQSATSLWVGGLSDLIGGNDLTNNGAGISLESGDTDFPEGFFRSTDGAAGYLDAGDVFDIEAADVAVLSLWRLYGGAGGNRILCGKGAPGLPYYELLLDASNAIDARVANGTDGLAAGTVTSASFFTGSVIGMLWKFDKTVAQTMDLWTSVADMTQVDISSIVASMDSVSGFTPMGQRISRASADLGLQAVYTGAAARGITKAAMTSLMASAGF